MVLQSYTLHTVATKIIRQASINVFLQSISQTQQKLEKSDFHQHIGRSAE